MGAVARLIALKALSGAGTVVFAVALAGAASMHSADASPRMLVTSIRDLVQSAPADKSTSLLDEVMRPITGLHHVQHHALAALDDNGNDAARVALDIMQAARGDTQFVDRERRSWLHTELVTLERAAQSFASDDGMLPDATKLKLGLLRSSIQTTVLQAREIAGRDSEDASTRSKAAELATSLHNIAGRLDGIYPALGGQQISFRVPGVNLERVKISGDNQYDRRVTWDSARFSIFCDSGRCDAVRARNWWFKGKVNVDYSLRGDPTSYTCHFYVNEQQSDNLWVDLLAPYREPSPRGSPAGALRRYAELEASFPDRKFFAVLMSGIVSLNSLMYPDKVSCYMLEKMDGIVNSVEVRFQKWRDGTCPTVVD